MSRQVLSASGAVREWAAREPDRVCLTFHGGGDAEPLTYRVLAEQTSSYARLYRARGLRPGDPVVLFADSTAGFAAAFLGAQEASLLAVPCPPPEPLDSQDLEEPLSRIPGLRPGRAVAFSVPGAEREQVLLADERRKDAPENATALKAAIREAVFVATRIVPDDILLLPPNTLPFTSSGKAMRPEVKRLYLHVHGRQSAEDIGSLRPGQDTA